MIETRSSNFEILNNLKATNLKRSKKIFFEFNKFEFV